MGCCDLANQLTPIAWIGDLRKLVVIATGLDVVIYDLGALVEAMFKLLDLSLTIQRLLATLIQVIDIGQQSRDPRQKRTDTAMELGNVLDKALIEKKPRRQCINPLLVLTLELVAHFALDRT
ncbi:hypothetical protein D3C77_424430 [compost metagenome]